MAKWPTKIIYRTLGTRLNDYFGSRAKAVRFDGDIVEAIIAHQERIGDRKGVVFYGFSTRTPAAMSGSGASLRDPLAIEFIVCVRRQSKTNYLKNLEILDDLMDDLEESAIVITDPSASGHWSYYDGGIQAIVQAGESGLAVAGTDIIARSVSKLIERRRDYTGVE